jgi:S-adenosylmethionine decarboxylase
MSDIFEHLIKEHGGVITGNHFIADLWGVVNHTDETAIMDCFEKACEDAGATVLFSHCHSFGEGCGSTGLIVLSESHLSFHQYFETHSILLDIFMCGKANPELAMPRILDFWKPTSQDITTLKRGIVKQHKLPPYLRHHMK